MSQHTLYSLVLIVVGAPGVIVIYHEWRQKRAVERERRLERWIKSELPKPPKIDVEKMERKAARKIARER